MMAINGHTLAEESSRFTYENRQRHSLSVNPETDTES